MEKKGACAAPGGRHEDGLGEVRRWCSGPFPRGQQVGMGPGARRGAKRACAGAGGRGPRAVDFWSARAIAPMVCVLTTKTANVTITLVKD